MKRLIIVAGIFLLIASMAAPAMAAEPRERPVLVVRPVPVVLLVRRVAGVWAGMEQGAREVAPSQASPLLANRAQCRTVPVRSWLAPARRHARCA